ncbi:glycosyltransferase family 2 protein [Cyanobium sp. ATX-6F1]
MSPAPRIIGLLKVKNEWPLAAVALVYALQHHVDVAYVLDHGSSDGTATGLAALQASPLGARIHVVRFEEEAFIEEAFMNALVEVAQASAPEWFYPFDADEILIAPSGLRELIESLPDTINALHYQVENWLSTSDFDETNLNHYRVLQVRSLPDQPFSPSLDPRLVEAIIAGSFNYFRLPFGGKVIFRNTASAWLAAGAHELRPSIRAQSLFAHRQHLRCAHLPLLSRGRLARKAAMGRRTIADGMAPWYNWQHQMIARLEELRSLESFWARHSWLPGGDPTQPTADGLRVAVDDSLQRALGPTLDTLTDLRLDLSERCAAGAPADAPLSLPADLYRLALRACAPHNARTPGHGPPPAAGATLP